MKFLQKVFFTLIAFFLMNSCSSEEKLTNTFTIEGEIKGLTSNLFFRHPHKEYTREYPNDTIFVKNGKFKLTDTITSLSMIRAYTDYNDENNNLYKRAEGGGYYPVKSMYLMFFAYPGASIKVIGEASDFMNAYPSGDDYNNSLATINKLAFPNFNESVNLLVESSFEKDSIKSKELQNLSDSISLKGELERINHIKKHPNSVGALWYLNDMVMRKQIEDDEAVSIFEKVSENLTQFEIYTALKTRIQGISTTKEGMSVPPIKSTATLDGSEFDINSLKGKYVLIDFWGVWCGPCVEEMPKVKEYQEKYSDKLVVLGINSGDTKEKMQNFITEKGYHWQQLMSDKKNTSDNFVNRFNVKGFPTKFIIDPNGKILKRFLGSGEDAFKLLDELLN